jgi:hypothetical protein
MTYVVVDILAGLELANQAALMPHQLILTNCSNKDSWLPLKNHFLIKKKYNMEIIIISGHRHSGKTDVAKEIAAKRGSYTTFYADRFPRVDSDNESIDVLVVEDCRNLWELLKNITFRDKYMFIGEGFYVYKALIIVTEDKIGQGMLSDLRAWNPNIKYEGYVMKNYVATEVISPIQGIATPHLALTEAIKEKLETAMNEWVEVIKSGNHDADLSNRLCAHIYNLAEAINWADAATFKPDFFHDYIKKETDESDN